MLSVLSPREHDAMSHFLVRPDAFQRLHLAVAAQKLIEDAEEGFSLLMRKRTSIQLYQAERG